MIDCRIINTALSLFVTKLLLNSKTCGVVDLRSSDALRRETKYVLKCPTETDKGPVKGIDIYRFLNFSS